MYKPREPSQPQAADLFAALDLAVVVPTLNDVGNLRQLLPQLQRLGVTVVVSDGGSTDDSLALLLASGVQLVVGCPNRGEQLARGALASNCSWLLFLHSDCRLSHQAEEQLAAILAADTPAWGRFDISLEPQTKGLNCVAWFMNQRSRFTKICTGDQGMFVHRSLLDRVGGVPCQPLMEDVELSKQLRRDGAPFVRLYGPVSSSARRWQAQGVLRTVLSMWRFRLRYWLGASPKTLANAYYPQIETADINQV